MTSSTRFSLYVAAALLFAAANPGCTCGADETVGPGSGGSDVSSSTGGHVGGGGGAVASSSASSTASSSSSTGAGGDGGQGGEGGAPPAAGKPGTETVSAGQRSSSPSYTMVHTLGQPSQNQGKTTSPSYRIQGGLQGANGSLP